MSKICRTFADDLEKIMEKRTYIQPKLEMAVLPKDAMMDFLASPIINPVQGRRGGPAGDQIE